MTKTEIITQDVIKITVPNLLEMNNTSFLTLTEGVCNVRRNTYFPMGYNILSCSALTNELTEKGNSRKIEFRLDLHNNGKSIWIDAKHLLKPSDIAYVCSADMQRALRLNGELWLIFFGNGYTDYIIKNIEEMRNNNVRLIRGTDELRLNLLGEL